MEPPSSADAAATGPKTVQAGANANPCHIHSKNFEDCLNSHEIKLGKCEDHLRSLYQCRRKKALVVMEEEAAAAAAMKNPDSCHIPYEKLKDCLKKNEVNLGKCELHLHVLFVCHMRARKLWS